MGNALPQVLSISGQIVYPHSSWTEVELDVLCKIRWWLIAAATYFLDQQNALHHSVVSFAAKHPL
jgi:hypothetical protein